MAVRELRQVDECCADCGETDVPACPNIPLNFASQEPTFCDVENVFLRFFLQFNVQYARFSGVTMVINF